MNIKVLLFTVILLSIVLVLSGCYTQLGTVRDEREPDDREYTEADRVEDSSYEQEEENDEESRSTSYYYYDDAWSWRDQRAHIGFSYYYPSYYWPSYAFTVAYNNPWFYDCYWSYDPWWCGTPYTYYPSYWNYSPVYYYYPYYYYRYPYSYDDSRVSYRVRDDGNTRGTRTPRTTTERGYDMPTGGGREFEAPSPGRIDVGTGVAVRKGDNQSVSPRTRKNDDKRGSGTRSDRRGVGRRSDSQNDNMFGNDRRDTRPKYRPNERTSKQPEYTPPTNSGSQERGVSHRAPEPSRRSAPSYTPPPAPPRSSPAPSSGGTRDGGSRGGNSSGGRRR